MAEKKEHVRTVAKWGSNAKIGKFGKGINFYCGMPKNKPKVMSFTNYKRSSSVAYEEHEIQGKGGYLEFLRKELDEISMTVVLDATLGVSPWKTEHAMRKLMNGHVARILKIGGYRMGSSKWVITGMNVVHNSYAPSGKPMKITVDLTFKEFRTKKKKTKTTKPNKSSKKKASNVVRVAKKKTYIEYITKEGDTCKKIAKKIYGKAKKYKKIYKANKKKIKNINKAIEKDTKLKIPLPLS